MKKSLFLIAFLLLAGRGFSQIMDSAAVAKQVDSLIQVSRGLTGKREFDKALEVNGVAEKLALEKFGRESRAFGSCCHNRGRVLLSKRNYLEAEKWYLEALDIRGKVLGKGHSDYATSLANLAYLYQSTGNYEKAELQYLEAKAILEKTLGKKDLSYAATLNNIGLLYTNMGAYEKAEQQHLESKAIREMVLGKKHSDYAVSLLNLASLYQIMGNYDKSELLYLESKSIWETTVGKEHPYYANSLNNLATLYEHNGNYELAESFYLQGISIKEKVLGKEHPDMANSLYNLANLYLRTANYTKAEALYLEVRDIREKTLGKADFQYAQSLNSLAILYQQIGRFEKAKPFYLEASDVWEKAVGKEHPEYAQSQNYLAVFYWAISDLNAAKHHFLEASFIHKSLLLKSTRHLSERELASYTHKFSEQLSQIYSFAYFQPDISGACYDNTLFHKGFLLNAATRVNSPMLRDSSATEAFYRLKSYNRRLATEYTKPIAERKGVEELEAQANDLEKELARTVAGYGEALRQVKWQEVQAALKPGEAAIEFVHYRFWDKKQTDSTMYAALVLLPLPAGAFSPAEVLTKEGAKEGGSKPPQFIPLFEEKQLASLLQRGTEPYEVHIKTLYAHAPSGAESLYQLIWQPLEATLASTKTIYFSPSGLLHRLNLAAVPTSSTATLADRHTLVELGSTRSLVVQSSLATGRGNEGMLFGGIQYDMDSTAILQANAALPTDTLAGVRRTLSFSQTDSTLRGGSWKYLPGSEKEVADAEKIMQESGLRVHTLRGYAATEEAFKNIGSNVGRVQNPSDVASPRILHLATHGFFFPDPKREKAKVEGADPVFKLSDNPFIRAGLILAGGNHAWKTGQPLRPGMDDGILTAYEISQMNLSNTELVVLSACETGLGDIQGNEGVYGLQRAFKIAGAKYVIMSLWQVPDQQTARLMTIFYKKWLGEKKTVPEAFRAAQQELRGRGFDPFYWAGFVLVE